MNICFAKKTRKYPLKNRALLVKTIYRITHHSGLESLLPAGIPAELAVVLVDDNEITQINEQYLHHEGPTDVISFDYLDDLEEETVDCDSPFIVGELYISLDTALRQSLEFDKTLNDELLLYIAHGILHLSGYDDHCEEDIVKMREAEKRVLKKVHDELGIIDVI